MTVTYAPRALADLRSIADFIEARSPQGVAAVMRRIEATVDLIERRPGVGRQVKKRSGVRVIPIGRYPYRIFYAPDGADVIVLHVRHSAGRTPRMSEIL